MHVHRCLGLVACSLVFFLTSHSAPLYGALIVDQTFLYDFDRPGAGFTAGGPLVTRDNWTGTNGSSTTNNTGQFGNASGLFLRGSSPTATNANRTNNAGFSFSIPDAVPRFDLEFDIDRGNSSTNVDVRAIFGLSTGGSPELYFGIVPAGGGPNRGHWAVFNGASLVHDPHDQDNLPGAPLAWFGGGSSLWHVRLQVDLQAGPGGEASLFLTPVGSNTAGAGSGIEQPEPDLQNIPMSLPPLLSSINQLHVQVNQFTSVDNLRITTFIEQPTATPEPTAAVLVPCGVFMLLGLRFPRMRSSLPRVVC